MLVIGDVVGHDTEAAAAMGQLRGLLRGIATYSDAGPVEVLRGLDASMADPADQHAGHRRRRPLRADALTSSTAGVTRMRWANAGHLPPLVIDPDGSVAELASWRGDLLLGVDPRRSGRESVVALDRGSTVLLYTDGLIERRDDDLDAGHGPAARGRCASWPTARWTSCSTSCSSGWSTARPEDDVALVAVRLHRQDRRGRPTAVPDRRPHARAAEPCPGCRLRQPVAADRRLAALDHRGPQRPDDALGGGLGHLDQRELLVDLDAADVAAAELGLARDRADEVAGPDAGVAAGADEQPRHGAAGRAAAPAQALAVRRAARRPAGPAALGPVRAVGPEADLRDLLVVVRRAAGLVRQLHRGQGDLA